MNNLKDMAEKSKAVKDSLAMLNDAINSVNIGKTSEKLTNVDGLPETFGDYLLWFDYRDNTYECMPANDSRAKDVRKYYKHWNVYLVGDIEEDKKEIKRQTFLSDNQLKKCYEDIGFEPPDNIDLDLLVTHVCLGADNKIYEVTNYSENYKIGSGTYITQFYVVDTNEEKRNDIIRGSLNQRFGLEQAILWCMELGYFSEKSIVKEMDSIRTAAEAWSI